MLKSFQLAFWGHISQQFKVSCLFWGLIFNNFGFIMHFMAQSAILFDNRVILLRKTQQFWVLYGLDSHFATNCGYK